MTQTKILAIDDEDFNLEIIEEILGFADYNVITALNGEEGLKALEENNDISVIVLDRMMPVMNGIQFMSHLKENEDYAQIPVIMQTAATSQKEIMEGINTGVYYYLTKPYDAEVLLSIVRAAEKDAQHKHKMLANVQDYQFALGMMESAVFKFKSLQETANLACFIANCFPVPERVVLGISELMVNAIEHGNLGISCEEKTALIQDGRWKNEVENRLDQKKYEDKAATLKYENLTDKIQITITDQGKGFDWKSKLDFSNIDMTAPNGRGIMMAKTISFDELFYNKVGNEVTCIVTK